MIFEALFEGFLNVLHPINLLVLFGATAFGFLGGAMPGISGTMMIIILLPVTYGMAPVTAFVLLTAVFSASIFSGSISAIMFRTPGTPEAVATIFDGYPLAQKGQTDLALGVAIMSSAMGGILGTLALIFITPALASFALRFSSPEYFGLAVLGLTVVGSVGRKNLVMGFMGVLFGLLLSYVGIDNLTAVERFTFGLAPLRSGIGFVPFLIGLFAVSEVIKRAGDKPETQMQVASVKHRRIFNWKEMIRIWPVILRSSIVGAIIGILPGVGATTAAMVSYSQEMRLSKTPEKFGTGIIEGIAAPESSNNAAANCTFVPLFALGIPGGASTAVILGAFILHGLQPGPLFLAQQTSLAYTVFVGLLLVNVIALVIAKPVIVLFRYVARVPYSAMAPVILVLCMLGTYAVRSSFFDVWVMFGFGVIGYFLERVKFPISTIILGVVLGPLAEMEFRRGLQMGSGEYLIFLQRPISAVLLILSVMVILLPFAKNILFTKKKV